MADGLIGSGLVPRDVSFYDFYKPSLPADGYVISFEAGVDGVGATLPTQTQAFIVEGPQFALPPSDVHSVYPPANSVGQFGKILPMVVLENRALPWERELVSGPANAPWVALLIFSDDEVTLDPANNSPLETMTVEAFLNPESGWAAPDIDQSLIAPDVLDGPVSTIALEAEVFRAVCPRLIDLPYLAHVRSNAMTQQAVQPGDYEPGWFSVVMANRFPANGTGQKGSGGRNHAVLVALEGWEAWLGDTRPSDGDAVRLAVLEYWSFGSIEQQGASFYDLAEHLADPETDGAQALLLRPPALDESLSGDPAAAEAAQRIDDGYVPLASKAPSGEDTFAWYRGPFTPVAAQPESTGAEWPRSASAAMIYDEGYAVFDHTYSAAWQVGRSLALADRSFSVDLLQLRREAGASLARMSAVLAANPEARLTVADAERKPAPMLEDGDDLILAVADPALTTSFKDLARFELNQAGAPRAPWRRRTRYPGGVQAIRDLVVRQDAADALAAASADLTPNMITWLAKLCLLNAVPFSHLAPVQSMLPVESLRFFYVDQNWLRAAMSGALSLGVHGSRDMAVHAMMNSVLMDAALDEAGSLRSQWLTSSTGQTGPGGPPQAGILLRSQLVSGWPGLEVMGEAQGAETPILRMERLDQTTLLVLFSEIPDTVSLSEPYQGLRFGADDNWRFDLRSMVAPVGKELTKTFPATGSVLSFERPAPTGGTPPGIGERVLDIGNALIPALQSALGPGVTLGGAGFALQAINAPERIQFIPTSTGSAQ